MEESLLLMLDTIEKYQKGIKKFNETLKPATHHRNISGRLEVNQANLGKIVENVGGMKHLFDTVKSEVEKVGDVSRAVNGFAEVDKLVS